jgi:hypothetical protein
MFRSGSTLVARMLNVHPDIVCASDPMRPLINSFRYDLADDTYRSTHSRYAPLDDYFIHNQELLKSLLQGDLSQAVNCAPKDLLSAVQERASAFSGLYAESIDLNQPLTTYRDAVAYLLETIQRSYAQGKDHRLIAFKEVWSNEFFPALKSGFPNAKCLMIIRDPRSVVASKVATGEPYPYRFMGRQWRKLACLSAYLSHHYGNDVMLVRYEDLVSNPEEHIRNICSFSEVEFKEELLDMSLYRDGRNKEWKQNTSFSDAATPSINTGTLDKWRSILSPSELSSLELYTYDWMQAFGYTPENTLEDLLNVNLNTYKRYQNSELAEWIRRFSYDDDQQAVEREIAIEKLRLLSSRHMPAHLKQGFHLAWW